MTTLIVLSVGAMTVASTPLTVERVAAGVEVSSALAETVLEEEELREEGVFGNCCVHIKQG